MQHKKIKNQNKTHSKINKQNDTTCIIIDITKLLRGLDGRGHIFRLFKSPLEKELCKKIQENTQI